MRVYLFYFVAFYNYARSLKQLPDLGGRQPPTGLAPPFVPATVVYWILSSIRSWTCPFSLCLPCFEHIFVCLHEVAGRNFQMMRKTVEVRLRWGMPSIAATLGLNPKFNPASGRGTTLIGRDRATTGLHVLVLCVSGLATLHEPSKQCYWCGW